MGTLSFLLDRHIYAYWVVITLVVVLYMYSVVLTGGGQQGQFAPGPQCKEAPKQCQTC